MQQPIPDQKGWSRLRLGMYTADMCLIQTILALLVRLITLTAIATSMLSPDLIIDKEVPCANVDI
jgi:hypothetical protein